jgi:hypothetical protein
VVDARYSASAPVYSSVMAKRFFLVKILCTYTMNYLRQEITLRDHEARRGEFDPYCRILGPWSGLSSASEGSRRYGDVAY